MTDLNTALRECPFCGGPARTLPYNGTQEATCAGSHECPGTDVLAPVAAWNRRAALPAEGLAARAAAAADALVAVPTSWQALKSPANMDAIICTAAGILREAAALPSLARELVAALRNLYKREFDGTTFCKLCGSCVSGQMASFHQCPVADFENLIREAAATISAPGGFQKRVYDWMLVCFGAEIAADRMERNHRFLEEALELVQACGCTASEAHQLVDYTFGRPIGEKVQEVGGVIVTAAALCSAQGIDMDAAGETELARIWTKVEVIRAKQAAKPRHSPLPAAPQQEKAG